MQSHHKDFLIPEATRKKLSKDTQSKLCAALEDPTTMLDMLMQNNESDQQFLNYLYNDIVLPFYQNKTGGIDTAKVNPNNNYLLLHYAVLCKQPPAILKALAETSDKDMVTLNNETPLMLAARIGHVTAIDTLMLYSAMLGSEEKRQKLLDIAIAHDKVNFAKNLLEKRLVQLNPQKPFPESSPIHEAARKTYQFGTQMLDTLISQGADVSLPDTNGNTPLHLLLYNRSVTHPSATWYAAKVLCDSGAPINARNNNGHTPLHIVTTRWPEDTELARYLVSRGALLNPPLEESQATKRLSVIIGHFAPDKRQSQPTTTPSAKL